MESWSGRQIMSSVFCAACGRPIATCCDVYIIKEDQSHRPHYLCVECMDLSFEEGADQDATNNSC